MFDAPGRLTSLTTRAGFATTLAYDGQGRLATVTDAFGRNLSFTYDASNRMETMTDPAARVYQYGYDAMGRLSTVTYPDTRIRTYVYENTTWLWALTGIIDERGIRYATYDYDFSGRGLSTEHAGLADKYAISINDSPTQVQVNTSDAFNQGFSYTFTKVRGAAKLTQYFPQGTAGESRTYDANGNPASRTDPRGLVTNYVYDATRNLESSRTEAYGTALA
jgi:YD repeat-containing protein